MQNSKNLCRNGSFSPQAIIISEHQEEKKKYTGKGFDFYSKVRLGHYGKSINAVQAGEGSAYKEHVSLFTLVLNLKF